MGKVSDLTEMTTLAEGDDLYVVDDVLSRRITALNLGNTLPVKATGSTTARTLAARFSDVINVKDYGATGDGVTDDTAAIQAAIDASEAAGGGIVYFPPGDYRTTSVLTVDNVGVTLMGAGRQATIITPDAGTYDVIEFDGETPGVTLTGGAIRDMKIDAANMTGGAVVKIDKAARFVADRLVITSPYNGLDIRTVNVCTFNSVWINGATGSYLCKWHGDDTHRSDVLQISDCSWSGSGSKTPVGILWDGNCHTLRIHGLGLINCLRGIVTQKTAGSTNPAFLYGHDVEIDFPANEAIDYNVGSDLSIHGIYAHGSDNEHGIAIANGVTRCTFSGGKVTSHEKAGFSIDSQYVSIVGVTTTLNSQVGAGTYSGIEIEGNATDIDINGGHSVGNTHAYGVHAKSGAIRITVTGTDLIGNATDGFLDATGGGNHNFQVVGCPGESESHINNVILGTTILGVAQSVPTISPKAAGANADLMIKAKGTGNIRLGTHTAIGAETVTGYITIKDEGGTLRKIAVVS